MGPMPVTLLYNSAAEIAHLQPGDQIFFFGTAVGSHLLPDQLPAGLNPHRFKVYAWYSLSISRPPPAGNQAWTTPGTITPAVCDRASHR